MVQQFSANYQYRIITISNNQQEIWLESEKDQSFPVIRLMRHDLDWANWLKRDIERTAVNGEQIRKKLFKKPLKVLTIYISKYAPVDDYSFTEKIQVHNKTTIQTFILDSTAYPEKINNLEKILNIPLAIKIPAEEEIEEKHIELVKQSALNESVKKVKEDQQIFQRGKPVFTYVFIAIQVIVFLLMEINGSSTNSKTLIEFGAKFSPFIMAGEWWRFLTPMFVHIGFLHLLMNTVSLYFIGTEVERIFGNFRFLLVYLFAGFTGTLASFIMTPNLSAGASGAIFGCFGALLYFGFTYPKLFFRSMGKNVIVLIVINLVYGFAVPGIDNAGHIGGLIGGFLAAGVVHLPKNKLLLRQILFIAGTVISTIFLLQYGYDQQGNMDGGDETTASIAQEYLQEGKENQAADLLINYIEKYEQAPYSNWLLGNIEYQNRDFPAAAKYYEQAIEQKPDLHEAHFNLGLVYYEMQRLDEAKQQVEKAAELAPEQTSYQELLQKLNQSDQSF
jgi:rhomboid protease GluP